MADVITADDLAAYLRVTYDELDAGVDLLIDLANGVVQEVTGDLDDYTARQRAIALEVAARAYRNPEGYSSETIDDYTYRRDAETRQAGVYLTASERDELNGTTATARPAWLA